MKSADYLPPQAPQYEELLEVVTHAFARARAVHGSDSGGGEAFMVDSIRYEEGHGLPNGPPACAFWSVWRHL